MKKTKNIDLTREVLNIDQQKIIKQKTLWLRILGFFLPLIYLLWARAYSKIGWYIWWLLLSGAIASKESGEIWLSMFVYILTMILIRILVLTNGAKRAFNNSKWHLKKIV